MNGFSKSRGLVAGILLAAVGTTSYLWSQTGPSATPPAPASMPSLNDPIATINGKDINNAVFYNLMMKVAGMRVFQQVFDLTLVQGACAASGIPLDGPDFDARIKEEMTRTLDALDMKSGSENDKLKVLNEMLQQRGITAVEFQLGLQRQAGLRALAKGKISVTDKELDIAYNAQYGEKVQVKLFQIGTISKGAELRKAIEVDKKSPEEAAAAVGIGAPASWTISKNATDIDIIRDTAFSLNEKQLSASFSFKDQLIMIYNEKKEPSQIAATPFPGVKAQLTKDVTNFKETQWMNNHLQNLRRDAVVKINDPELQAQFTAMAAQMQANAGASTQPGGATLPSLPVNATGPAMPKAPATAPAASRPK